MEMFKVRAQVNKHEKTSYPQLIRDIYRKDGFFGFYRGYWAMFWRDVPWYGLFFFCYDWGLKATHNENDSTGMKYFKKAMVAGTAGLVNWLPSYAVDVVKSY